jgi:trans-2,3-dihydro-3-hydroxyanthranilate isomerase
MGLNFTLVDVFSDRPFGGNQLAVFPDAAGITDETMQQLAREFNFSETTFVLPPRDPAHTCQVRIFTPYQELPFAGHPTVGTAAVLASLDQEPARPQLRDHRRRAASRCHRPRPSRYQRTQSSGVGTQASG